MKTFFCACVCKQLKIDSLPSDLQSRRPQSLVKEELTRKVFWNRDLADLDCNPSLGGSGGMTLRCECARLQSALFMATVKVVRHIRREFRCGKRKTSCRFGHAA